MKLELTRSRFTAPLITLALTFFAASIASAGFPTFNVDDPTDLPDTNPGDGLCSSEAGSCTLRAGIEEGDALGTGIVNLPAGTYVLDAPVAVLHGVVLVYGSGADATTIDANGAEWALVVAGGGSELHLAHVTVHGGAAAAVVAASEATLTLEDAVIRDNPVHGVSVLQDGNAVIRRSILRDNGAQGLSCADGGSKDIVIIESEVSNNGTDGIGVFQCWVDLTDSVVFGNAARGISAGENGGVGLTRSTVRDNLGGGLSASGLGSIHLDGSTVSNNTADQGAGIRLDHCGVLRATNSTISGNRATGDGGGVYRAGGWCGDSTLTNTTISKNTADSDQDGAGDGGGVFDASDWAEFRLRTSLIAGNEDRSGEAADCVGNGVLISAGFNLIGDASGCALAGDSSTDLFDIDPLLGPLAANGGATETHRLLLDSPAIDAISPADCTDENDDPIPVDHRGLARPQGAGCDIGSYELGATEIRVRTSGSGKINPDRDGPIAVAILGSDILDVADVDEGTLALGADGPEEIGASAIACRTADRNRDGHPDLTCRYTMRETGITVGDTQVCLLGATQDGAPFEGCAAIRTFSPAR